MIYEITIPVLNEERSLELQTKKILKFIEGLDQLGNTFRLLIADNGSTDKTGAIAEKLASENPSISYLRLPMPGVGAALKASWDQSNADIIGYMDLDLSTDISHLKDVLQKFDDPKVQLVNGSRLLKDSVVVGRKPLREITSRGFNIIISLLFKTNFTDGMCGFKFLRKEVLGSIRFHGANNEGWFFSTEVLVIGEKLGYHVAEIPVKWVDDPDSRVKVAKLTIRYLKDIINLRRKLNSFK